MQQQASLPGTREPDDTSTGRGAFRASLSNALQETAVLAALAALPGLFFWQLFTFNPLDVATIARGDFTDIHYPYRLFLARTLASGDSPFWNPYAVAGHPALGDIQYQVFYPLGLLFQWLLGNDFQVRSLELLVAAHLSLASIFTYLFARQLVVGRLGPAIAALAFTYGGYLTTFPVQQVIILQASVWLPLILLLLELAIVKRRVECYSLAGVAAAMAILAGHPQTAVYGAVGAGLYGLFRLWDVGFTWRALIGLAAVPILALGIAAVQLYPSLQHLQLTARTEVSFTFARSGHALRELIGLVLPTELGGRALYLGMLPLVLAMMALANRGGSRARVFWALLAFAALLVSFGGNTFAQPALYATVPGLQFFRNHERTAFLLAFATSILAAYGASDIGRAARDEAMSLLLPTRRLVAAAAAASLAIAVSFVAVGLLASDSDRPIFGQLADRAFLSFLILIAIAGVLGLAARPAGRRALIPALMVGLVIFDLFSTNWQNNLQPATSADQYPITKTIQLLKSDRSGLFRVASEGLLPGGGNAGIIYELYDVVGNSPLELDAFHRFDQAIPEWQRWRLLNVKYVLTKRKLDDGRLIPRLTENDVNLYEIDEANRLPRAYVVNDAIVTPSPDEALEKTKTIDPLREVVLSSDPGISLRSQAGAPPQAEVSFRSYRNTEIVLDVSTPSNGILVVSEVYCPGWAAEVDGRPAQVLEADYLLRGIPLLAGDHQVRLVYQPPGFAAGATISAISLAVALVTVPLLHLSRRRSHTHIESNVDRTVAGS